MNRERRLGLEPLRAALLLLRQHRRAPSQSSRSDPRRAPGDAPCGVTRPRGRPVRPPRPGAVPELPEEDFASGMGVWSRSCRCRAQSWGWSLPIPGMPKLLPAAARHLLDEVETSVHGRVHLPAAGQPCGDRPAAGSPSLSPPGHPLEKGRAVLGVTVTLRVPLTTLNLRFFGEV